MPTTRARWSSLFAWAALCLVPAIAADVPTVSPFRTGLDGSQLGQDERRPQQDAQTAVDDTTTTSTTDATTTDQTSDVGSDDDRRQLQAPPRDDRTLDERAYDGDWRREPPTTAAQRRDVNADERDVRSRPDDLRATRDERRGHGEAETRGRKAVDDSQRIEALAKPDPTLRWDDRTFSLPRLGQSLWARAPMPRPIPLDYRLQPGDLVRVVVWGGARVNQLVPVDAGGNLGVPEHGPIPVAGLTQIEAQARLVELARSFFKNAGAVLAVERPQAQAATVVGEVANGGYLSLPPGGTVLEALAAAGGPLPLGGVRALRVSSPGQPDETIDLYRLAVDGDGGALKPLPTGAIVFVPPAGPQVQVFGAVRRPACIELKPGDALTEAIRLAGGVEAFADTDTIRLLREDARGQRLDEVSLAQLAQTPVQAGDRLLVEPRASLAQGRRTVTVFGAVRTPGTYAFAPGMTASQALDAAGGLAPDADLARAIIRRRLAEPRQLELAGGVTVPVYEDLVAVVDNATELQALDELVVPRAMPLERQVLTVRVDGEVLKPGDQPLVPDMTVRDLVRLAGGVGPQAEIDEADLVRSTIDAKGDRSVRRERIDLKAILSGDPGPALAAGDTLVVRRRKDERISVRLSGEVRNAGDFTVPSGTTLGEIVRLAGGLTTHAFLDGAALYRESERVAAMQHLKDLAQRLESTISINQRQLSDAPADADRVQLQATIANQQNELVRMRQAQATGRLSGIHLAEILAGKSDDVPLQDGDALTVPAHPGTVRVLGEIMTPGSIRYERDLKAQLVIQRSGGPTTHADTERIYVVRADGTVVASANGRGTSWSSEERRYVRTSLKSLDLREGDTVIVPPDLRYHEDGLKVAKDVTQIMFQVAAATGTVALLAK